MAQVTRNSENKHDRSHRTEKNLAKTRPVKLSVSLTEPTETDYTEPKRKDGQ
jgi:hypothetical protein